MSDPMDVNKDDLAPEGKAPKADAADTVRDTAPEGEAPTADAAAADTVSTGCELWGGKRFSGLSLKQTSELASITHAAD